MPTSPILPVRGLVGTLCFCSFYITMLFHFDSFSSSTLTKKSLHSFLSVKKISNHKWPTNQLVCILSPEWILTNASSVLISLSFSLLFLPLCDVYLLAQASLVVSMSISTYTGHLPLVFPWEAAFLLLSQSQVKGSSFILSLLHHSCFHYFDLLISFVHIIFFIPSGMKDRSVWKDSELKWSRHGF